MHLLFLLFVAFLSVWVVEATVHFPLDILNWIHLPRKAWLVIILALMAWALGD